MSAASINHVNPIWHAIPTFISLCFDEDLLKSHRGHSAKSFTTGIMIMKLRNGRKVKRTVPFYFIFH